MKGKGSFLQLLAVLFLACILNYPLRAAENKFPSEKGTSKEDQDSKEEQSAKKKKKRFRGYSKHSKQFKLLCNNVAQDGRNEFLYSLAKANDVNDPDCPTCKSFFKILARGCKIKKKRPRRGEPEPTPVKKQREPSAQALNTATSLFSEVFSLEDHRDKHLQAVKKLVTLLRTEEGKTKAERDYFRILAEYIYAPFKDYALRIEKKERKVRRKTDVWLESEEDKDAKLKALFDF